MAGSLSPETLAALVQKGIITPQQASAAQNPAPFGQQFGGAGLQLPPSGPAAPPPASVAPQPQAPPQASTMDANNASAQSVLSQMTPDQKAAMAARSAQGVNSALGGIAGPRTVQQAPQQAGPSGPVQGVFAQPSQADAASQMQQQQFPSAVSRPQVLPAHAVSTVSPETRALFGEADAAKMDAANQGEQAENAAAENEAAAALTTRDTLAKQQEAMEQAEARRTKAYDDQWADYERLRREAASGKIEKPDIPLMGHIAMALGAAGAALAHTQNFAMESINKRIDDSIATQRANLETKKDASRNALEGLGQMRSRFGDERVAEAAERARQLEQAKATGDVMVAQAKSPMLAAKWAGIRANLDQEQAAQHGALEKWQPAMAVGGTGKTAAEIAKYEAELVKSGRMTPNAAHAEALRWGAGAYANQESPFYNKPGGASGGGRALAKGMVQQKTNIGSLKELKGLLGQTYLSAEQAARANVLLANAKDNGVAGLPTDVGRIDWGRMTGAQKAAIGAAIDEQTRKLGAAQDYLANGPGGAPEENGDEYIRPAGEQ